MFPTATAGQPLPDTCEWRQHDRDELQARLAAELAGVRDEPGF